MRRVCLLAVALLCGLAAAAPALALPQLSPSRTREVATLINRFVNDLVRGRNLADGWKVSGSDMRGAITHKAWVSGRQLPLQQFDVVNDPRTAWYATWKTRSELGLVVSLKTGHGRNAEMYDEETVIEKQHGHWVVDSFYVDGIFRFGRGHSGSCVSSKCKVTGLADYAAGHGGSLGVTKPRISSHWALGIVGTLGGLAALTVLTIVMRIRVRDRRARAAYLASRIS